MATVPEQHRLGQRAGVVEVRRRLALAAAGVRPRRRNGRRAGTFSILSSANVSSGSSCGAATCGISSDPFSPMQHRPGRRAASTSSGRPSALARRELALAVVPGQLQRLAGRVLGAGELVGDRRPLRPHLAVDRRGLGPDRRRGGQLQRQEDRVEDVAAEVAELAVAEVLPGPPVEGVVDLLLERPRRGRRRATRPSGRRPGPGRRRRAGRRRAASRILPPCQEWTSFTLPIAPSWTSLTAVR